jgi:HAE1 family hydrophobic/amphiphilic exporter-1
VIAWALDHRLAVVVVALGTFFGAFTLPMKGFTGLAAVAIGVALMVWGVTRRNSSWLLRLGSIAAGLVVAFGLFKMAPELGKVGVGFFPLDDRAEFTIQLETPPGSNLEYTRIKAEEAARLVRAHPEVEYTYTTLGGGISGAVDVGSMYVRMAPREDRGIDAETFASGIREEVTRIAGARARGTQQRSVHPHPGPLACELLVCGGQHDSSDDARL